MRPPLCSRFVDKAEAAIAAAVEVFNKPMFSYREETFAVLAINGWELLLKARLLQLGSNHPKVLRVYEKRPTKQGRPSKKLYVKRNRSGNPMTKALPACVAALDDDTSSRLPKAVKDNLDALLEIRDNASHYINASPVLAKQVVEIGSAAIQNFMELTQSWFGRDLSKSFSLVLPLSFLGPASEVAFVAVNPQEDRLIKYLRRLAAAADDSDRTYSVAVRLQVKLERSKLDTATRVKISDDPEALAIQLTEENIREKYPWDYRQLVAQLKRRYSDFKENAQFHQVRKPLMTNKNLVRRRYLDPANLRSASKDYYNPNILKEFDQAYTKRSGGADDVADK